LSRDSFVANERHVHLLGRIINNELRAVLTGMWTSNLTVIAFRKL